MENSIGRITARFLIKKTSQIQIEKRLYFLLYEVLKEAIMDKDIPDESSLPASRQLATELVVSRSTILKAYELLLLEGYIVSKPGSGYFVKNRNQIEQASDDRIKSNYPRLSKLGKSFLNNLSLINTTDDKSVAFRPGVPPLDLFPVNQWKNLTNLYWRHIKSSALTYSPSTGNEQLKKNIANYLNFTRGIKCSQEQIIIVSGSLQSLYLISSVLINKGDPVVMENPSFPNVISIFKSLMAKIEGVDLDAAGIKVDEIQQQKTKLIHVTPSGHYPTGIKMSLERKNELLQFASKQQSYIIENDFEHEISNYRDSNPSVFTLDSEDRTIFISTFNRLLHPSIRIGYMVLPIPLIAPVDALLKHSHRFVSPSIQIVLNQFIEKKFLFAHIKNVHRIALERKRVFIETFEEQFADEFILTNKASNSLHLLAEFKAGKERIGLIQEFAENNIVVHAYSKCFLNGDKKNGLILGYSSVKTPVIKREILKMKKIYNQIAS